MTRGPDYNQLAALGWALIVACGGAIVAAILWALWNLVLDARAGDESARLVVGVLAAFAVLLGLALGLTLVGA